MNTESTDALKPKDNSNRRDFLKFSTLGIGAVISADAFCGMGTGPAVSGEVDVHPPLIDEIVQPENAPDVGVKVRLGKPVEVMLAPEGDERWGFFMFPSIWRLRDGRLVCAVTTGGDHMPAETDYHYLWYISNDEGQHWTHAVIDVPEAEAFLRERFTLASGRQIYYEPKLVSLDLIDTKPYPVDSSDEYGFFRGIKLLYRLGDLPEEHRYVTMYEREPDEEQWKTHRATMDPDILLPAFKETVVDEDPIDQLTHGYIATRLRKWVRHVGDQRLPNPGIWVHQGAQWATPKDLQGPRPKNVALRLRIPTPSAVRLHDMGYQPIMELGPSDLVVSAFGTRLRLAENKAPGNTKTHCQIFRSSDAGRNWSHWTTFPYGSAGDFPIAQLHITPNMPAGNWMAAVRTWSKQTGTAKSPLLLTRSYDEGRHLDQARRHAPQQCQSGGRVAGQRCGLSNVRPPRTIHHILWGWRRQTVGQRRDARFCVGGPEEREDGSSREFVCQQLRCGPGAEPLLNRLYGLRLSRCRGESAQGSSGARSCGGPIH